MDGMKCRIFDPRQSTYGGLFDPMQSQRGLRSSAQIDVPCCRYSRYGVIGHLLALASLVD